MNFGREKLCFLNTPTPLEKLESISKDFDLSFYLKRDDLTNYGTGGNKLRKLEYLIKDALLNDATMVVTTGGAQTNHGRLTAAIAAKYGLKSAIVAVDPYPGEISANLLLDGIMGCNVYLVRRKSDISFKDTLNSAIENVISYWEEKGEKVYYIPMGGSNPIGALGYYDCALELYKQIKDLKIKNPHIYVTVGSFGTYTGLATAIAHEKLDIKLTGITIMPYDNPKKDALNHYMEICKEFNINPILEEKDFDIINDFHYGGYNNPVRDVRNSIYFMGRKEGIILDPCYTGKTFNALRILSDRNKLDKSESLIMIHTGGIPGIYTKHHRLKMEEELMPFIHII